VSLSAAALLFTGQAAAGDPDLDWWTIETTHFRVHHPSTLEPMATRVAALMETVHDRLSVALGYSPKGVTEVVITDDTDSANGSANPVPFNTIRLFVAAPEDLSALGDYDDWLLDLVTHEYTHILHTDNVSGIPAIVNAVAGKILTPNQFQPRWIIEGLAVLNETEHSSAGRLRSSLFDMYLRADVLADRIARLDQMSSSPIRWPQGNIWYLYGSRFLGWISDVYGSNTMRAVSADFGASLAPWGINRAIRRVTGRTYEELYEGFKDYLRRRYAAQMRDVERRGLREGTRLTQHGRIVHYPRFIPATASTGDGSKPGQPIAQGEDILYFRGDYNDRSGLYRFRLTRSGTSDLRAGTEELVARTSGTSSATFTPRGDILFNSTAVWKNLYARDDLFAIPAGTTAPDGTESERRRLTIGLRASAPDVSPDGRRVVFTVHSKGTRYLDIADLTPDGQLARRRNLVPSARYEQAFTPRFSPDGRSIAYSAWTAGGYRDIRIVDAETGAFRQITRDRALDTNPVWSPDGGTLYFCSDRTGIFNVYAYDVARSTLAQVTNVRVGALHPAVSADGKTLVYVGYGTEGHDLYAMSINPARFLAAPAAPQDRPDPPTEPSGVRMHRKRYNPLATLAPRTYSLDYKPGIYGANAVTVSALGADVVGHHVFVATLVGDPAAPSPSFSIDYAYRRLPVDLGLRFYHGVSPRGGYRIGDQEKVYDEYSNAATSSLSYTVPQEFSAHGFGVSHSVAAVQGDLPGVTRPDPYATRTILPARGLISTLHLGYSFANVEGGLDTPGAARGVSINVGVDFADRAIGSSYSLQAFDATVRAYIPMPWPGHHTLALRTSGAIAGGSFSRGGFYYVGGYDLETYDLIDTVTTGVFNGSFVLRGYPPRAAVGRAYVLQTAEYRLPILKPDVGLSTLPLYLRRIDGAVFLDYGGAFDKLRLHDIKLFHEGKLIDSPDLHTSVGAEIWVGLTLGYFLSPQFRLGYAYGFSAKAIEDGQLYFVASSAF
jgi:hypothetical protein